MIIKGNIIIIIIIMIAHYLSAVLEFYDLLTSTKIGLQAISEKDSFI